MASRSNTTDTLIPNKNTVSNSSTPSATPLANDLTPYPPRPTLSVVIPDLNTSSGGPSEMEVDMGQTPQQHQIEPAKPFSSVPEIPVRVDPDPQMNSTTREPASPSPSSTPNPQNLDDSKALSPESEDLKGDDLSALGSTSNEAAPLSDLAMAVINAKDASDLPPIFVQMLGEAFEAVENGPLEDPEVLCTFCYRYVPNPIAWYHFFVSLAYNIHHI